MSERKLGVVKDIVEAAGMGIAHVYEDLVFLNHNAFLLQFTKDSGCLLLHLNRDAEEELAQEQIGLLKQAAQEREMRIDDGGGYALAQDGEDSLRIEFFPHQ
ncbi:hypothetical protein [Candidatus Electronema sp. JC]|uniref:hypothetical protein n=1 Tax=Candidatus Electronema sp. JC TaxID=3401570 RepID=UPI003AA9721B